MPQSHRKVSVRALADGGTPLRVHPPFFTAALGISIATLVLGVTRTAAADAAFPDIIKKRWNITSFAGATAEGCTLCHQNNDGGPATATRPFGKTMLKLRVIGVVPDTLPPALDRDRQGNIDSDGDKVSDYQELVVDHTNPNDPKSFVVPPLPDAGVGEGGQGGATSSGGEGGQQGVSEPAAYTPPPLADLPPPFEHGCTLAAGAPSDGFAALFALGVTTSLLVKRRRRAR
jgi:hypothetical protein